MKKPLLPSLVLAALACAAQCAVAGDRDGQEHEGRGKTTVAVIGDWPYGPALFKASDLLVKSINADPRVEVVLHVGDIHSGSQPCSGAGLSPLPAGADPGYNQSVADAFAQFDKPVVYTPGDNEWTDCHKKKEFSSGAPLNELAAVRQLFFPVAGQTLGGEKKQVRSQAEHYSPVYPSDAQFVENVLWEDAQVVFAAIHMPGSNNDGLVWTAPFTDETARTREAAQRTGAAIRWLRRVFGEAGEEDAKGVVIGLQADMWDPAAIVAGGDGLANYTLFVHELANLSRHFGRPVLLINGDSHVFGSDRPLADPSSATGLIHATVAVPNLTRITVQGSTTAPAEWLRLSIDTRSADVFSWKNVPYCATPAGASCP
jgi:hypothetical protein